MEHGKISKFWQGGTGFGRTDPSGLSVMTIIRPPPTRRREVASGTPLLAGDKVYLLMQSFFPQAGALHDARKSESR